MPHKDLNDYSPVAEPDRVDLLQTTSYEHKAENLRNLWARAGECMGMSLEYAYWLDFGSFLKNTETADGERYFYHSDHLGSSAYITTENGYATQFLAYMPYGETLAEQQNGTSYYSPFKFSAKDKDPETGYSYFGARYYSPELSVWLSVDPMSDKYPSWSAYNYTLNNPVKFIDPNGTSVWHPDAEGNLIADIGDDATTLSEYLGIEYEEAKGIFNNLKNWDGGNNTAGISDVAGHTLSMTDPGLRIGNIAEYYLGSTAWNYDVPKGNYPAGSNKCNIFCYDVTSSANASPGTPNVINPVWSKLPFVSRKYGPPFAGQWADPNYQIPGWEVLGANQTPRRGDVAAYQFPYSDASGHVAIVSKPGFTIGTSGTNQRISQTQFGFDPMLSNGQPILFRRFTGR